MAEEKKQLHIAMFPWLAFGHMIPFLELSKQIAQKGHRISFLSTPRNISRLPRLPPNLSPLITFVPLQLPPIQNLPQEAEATTDLPVAEVPYLKQALDLLAEPLTRFLEAAKPDCIVYDFAPYWLPPIAAKLRILQAYFSIFWAATCCLGGSEKLQQDYPRTTAEDFTSPPKWVPFPTKAVFKLHEAKKLLGHSEVNDSGVSDMFRHYSVMAGCDLILVRSCNELEADYLSLLQEIHRKPILPVGLLPPVLPQGQDEAWLTIESWLANQSKGSVVYEAFGSEATLSQSELTELATGLELSGLPFFWAFRKGYDSMSLELPDGFEERTKGRGLVWTSWAPQVKILAHGSVGGFLTHTGWSSVIEGLAFGLPLIMFPIAADQGMIARVFEDKMVGMEIPRNEEDGSFTRYSVAETLKLVLMDEKGKIYRDKALEMMKLFGDKKLHDGYVDELVEFVKNCERPDRDFRIIENICYICRLRCCFLVVCLFTFLDAPSNKSHS